jgi:hypothetical protein
MGNSGISRWYAHGRVLIHSEEQCRNGGRIRTLAAATVRWSVTRMKDTHGPDERTPKVGRSVHGGGEQSAAAGSARRANHYSHKEWGGQEMMPCTFKASIRRSETASFSNTEEICARTVRSVIFIVSAMDWLLIPNAAR